MLPLEEDQSTALSENSQLQHSTFPFVDIFDDLTGNSSLDQNFDDSLDEILSLLIEPYPTVVGAQEIDLDGTMQSIQSLGGILGLDPINSEEQSDVEMMSPQSSTSPYNDLVSTRVHEPASLGVPTLQAMFSRNGDLYDDFNDFPELSTVDLMERMIMPQDSRPEQVHEDSQCEHGHEDSQTEQVHQDAQSEQAHERILKFTRNLHSRKCTKTRNRSKTIRKPTPLSATSHVLLSLLAVSMSLSPVKILERSICYLRKGLCLHCCQSNDNHHD